MRYKDSLNIPNLIGKFDQSVPGHFETDKFVFFWAGPFSNWEPSEFVMDTWGATTSFNTSEQAMMYYKAMHFNDKESAEKIMATTDPAEQKRLGRAVRNYDETQWDGVREGYTDEFLLCKFYQNNDFRLILDATGDKEIVEASPYDTVWGIGMGVNDPDIENRDKWRGQNLLGKSLMRVRSTLRELSKNQDSNYDNN